MPGLGLGVFQIPNEQVSQVVKDAIISGYRAIDTAAIYGNEAGTGAGIKAGLAATGLSRQDLFITSKVWNNHLSYDETIAAFNDSLAKLGLDYLDLYLIHWPGKAAFKEAKVPLVTLTNYEAVLDVALRTGYIEESDVETLNEWRKDPAHWDAGK